MTWGTRMGTFLVPYNFFAEVFTMVSPYLKDYKVHNAKRKFKSS